MRDFAAEERAYKDIHQEARKSRKRNLTVIDGTIVDNETGEVVNDRYELVTKAPDEVRRKWAEGQRVKQELADHHDQNGGFVFAYYESCKAVTERLPGFNQPDLARLMLIGTYVNFGTNHLTHPNGRAIDKKALAEILGMSRNKFSEFYKRLVEGGAVIEAPTGLIVNAELFYRGYESDAPKSVDHLQHTRMYRKTVRELYEMLGSRSVKKLGIVYSVLPYVNFKVNTVCRNPQNSNEDELDAMTIGELADILGYEHVGFFAKTLKSIKHNGQSVFKLVEDDGDARSKYIIVNPNVVYAGNGDSLKGLKVLFR
ncbi:hypothetical protein KIS4809_4652 [Bacillus sp. ZZV12-4809]|nr:hypothetical protein KIS4809_4652 [Bacillus sp. ZZV12-4809]